VYESPKGSPYDQEPLYKAKNSRSRRPSSAGREDATTKARPPKKMCVALAFLYAALTKKRDPNEEPIILLGSVFDVNSLGKWIYDWTVCCNAPATPLAEMAADLWLLLLIRLAGNRKWIEEEIPKIRKKESYKMVECGGLMERWA
jgi:hypothetical protein